MHLLENRALFIGKEEEEEEEVRLRHTEMGYKVGPRLRELARRPEGARRRDSRNLGPTF